VSGVWVFGYGSLVSPKSFGFTLGRELQLGVDVLSAEIRDFGRRWNYGVMSRLGRSDDQDGSVCEWTIVALGVTPAVGESVNGVVAWVADAELAALDARERNYDRVDVTDLTTVPGEGSPVGPVVTYVPQDAAVRWYETARERGVAAVERRYWDLVGGAFAALGDGQRDRYLETTPAPDVPIVDMRIDSVPARHRTNLNEVAR
jgi:cation transport regulator ChaC